jgi:hypothetical protein
MHNSLAQRRQLDAIWQFDGLWKSTIPGHDAISTTEQGFKRERT